MKAEGSRSEQTRCFLRRGVLSGFCLLLLGLQVLHGGLDSVFSEHAAVQLHWRQLLGHKQSDGTRAREGQRCMNGLKITRAHAWRREGNRPPCTPPHPHFIPDQAASTFPQPNACKGESKRALIDWAVRDIHP